MTTQSNTLPRKSSATVLRLALLSCLTAALPLLSVESMAAQEAEQSHADHGNTAPAKLVELVRYATRQFINVSATKDAKYYPLFGCVSGPDHGAMGVHYINSFLVGDGEIDGMQPEALIYEPAGKRMRLVGVEYIVDAATWMSHHDSPPILEGQAFQLVSSPNRYGLPTFFELHVWAWRDNPNGAFVDWNNNVTCENQ